MHKNNKNKVENYTLEEKKQRIASIVDSILEKNVSKSDPDGHYTGCPKGSENIVPIQDSDDL